MINLNFIGLMLLTKTSNSIYLSFSSQILNEKSAFSPAIVVFEKYNYYQSTANRLFSLPWNYPNKWTVPLNLISTENTILVK